VPPGPLVYDVVFPINSSAHVVRPEEGDIGSVTVRIEVPVREKATWREMEELAAPYAQERILNMVAPGGGIGLGKVTGVIVGGAEKRPGDAREISGYEGAFVWDVSIQRKKPTS
jgi:hypothetical protein